MENSIETIWQQGFLKSDALVAPKINNLYKQKSIDIVEKFKRMYRINLYALLAFSVIVLFMAFVTGVPYMGMVMFLIFNVTVAVNIKFKKKLYKIDNTQNSYDYLTSFNLWMKEILAANDKISRYLYPFVFLSLVVGFWFAGIGGDIPGDELVGYVVARFPDTVLIFGIPIIVVLAIIFIMIIISFFGARLGRMDFNIIYGRILKKLEQLLSEMEKLRT